MGISVDQDNGMFSRTEMTCPAGHVQALSGACFPRKSSDHPCFRIGAISPYCPKRIRPLRVPRSNEASPEGLPTTTQ